MALKVKYDSLEEVPEKFHELFVEQDGKFVLQVEGMKTEADIKRLTDSLSKERNEHKATKESLKKFEGLDPEKIKEEQEELAELRVRVEDGEGKGPDKETIDKLVEQKAKRLVAPVEAERNDLKKQLDALTGENTGLKSKIASTQIETVVRKACADQKIIGTATEDVIAAAERIFGVQEDGSVTTKDNVGVTPGLDVLDWLADMKDKRPHWWPASQGGGAKGGKDGEVFSNNPWDKNKWNLTEQGKLIKADPARAKRMAEQAGSYVGAARPEQKSA